VSSSTKSSPSTTRRHPTDHARGMSSVVTGAAARALLGPAKRRPASPKRKRKQPSADGGAGVRGVWKSRPRLGHASPVRSWTSTASVTRRADPGGREEYCAREQAKIRHGASLDADRRSAVTAGSRDRPVQRGVGPTSPARLDSARARGSCLGRPGRRCGRPAGAASRRRAGARAAGLVGGRAGAARRVPLEAAIKKRAPLQDGRRLRHLRRRCRVPAPPPPVAA
jgi:hypothetical protein